MSPTRRLRSVVLVAAISIAALSPALAATASEPRVVARQMVEASGLVENMQNAVDVFLDEGKRQFLLTNPDLQKDLDDSAKALEPEFKQRQSELIDQIADVYAQRFTVKEMTDIIAFYQSPTGVKLKQIQPAAQQASYEKFQAWSQQMTQDVITRLRAEMKKKGHDI